MEACFHLKIAFNQKCIFAGLYAVTTTPSIVAVSVHNKMDREKDVSKLSEFVALIKASN